MIRHAASGSRLSIELRDMESEPCGTPNQRPLRRTRVAAHVARQITDGFAQQPRFPGTLIEFRQCKRSVSRVYLGRGCRHCELASYTGLRNSSMMPTAVVELQGIPYYQAHCST
jgi:hypothetical protein